MMLCIVFHVYDTSDSGLCMLSMQLNDIRVFQREQIIGACKAITDQVDFI